MDENVDTPIEEAEGFELPEMEFEEEDHQPERKSGIPAGIKYGLFGLLFLVFVVGTVVVMSLSKPEPVEEKLVFDQASLSDIAKEPLTVAPPVLIDNEQSLADDDFAESNESVERLDEKVLALEQTLLQSSSQVAMQRDAVARQSNSIQEVMTSLEQSRVLIAEYAGQVDALNERLATLEANVGQNSDQLRLIKTKATRKRQARPSFQLLSIDQWDGQDSVVLELQDKTTVAAVGDIRAGWSIHSIERPNCIDVVRLSDKAKAKVCRKRRS